MKVDAKGLATLMAEASQLANRSKLTAQDEKRYRLLLSQISLLKTGEVTLADLTLDEVNEVEKRNGLSVTRRQAPVSETRSKGKSVQQLKLRAIFSLALEPTLAWARLFRPSSSSKCTLPLRRTMRS
jgi:hypothetical protein